MKSTYFDTESSQQAFVVWHTFEMSDKNDKWIIETKRITKERKITQQELADRLGVSRGALGHWLTGTRIPRYENICAIASVLGVSVTQLTEPDADAPTQQELDLLRDIRALNDADQAMIQGLVKSLNK